MKKELYGKRVITKVQRHRRAAVSWNAAALLNVLHFLTCQTYIRIDKKKKTNPPKTAGLR